jgi:serine phosphatase RsbU (regulator of sigma subunit)
MIRIYIITFLFLSFLSNAQTNAFKNDPHYKEHIGIKESFFGSSEDDFMVCYPKAHRSLFATIFGLGLITVAAITYALVTQRKSNKKLFIVNKLNEEKNKDLTDSINYSLRIQNAILPQIPDSFTSRNSLIYYKPKDIVSGDTYWIDEINQYKIFIIADCTGHGVPGALLTMLVNSSIQKALFENDLINPTAILGSINTQIKTSLKQNLPSAVQDSVDMSVVVFNSETNELQFAGANSHIFIIKNKVIDLIKGSKCTVGSVQAHVTEHPSTISIQLNKEDSFILYTDGIVDQIGGLKNQKLKRSGFQQLIESSLKDSLLSTLSVSLDKWKHHNEQVDDITLIGYTV